ncbi:MAG TPA: NgoFVII family restriction endonuclease [Candidatus Merdenecus merdavium]|nr:NgoFVII family restriction endonuclease [Candidatus Merdenecus merdavium]
MANILWKHLDKKERDEYERYLKIFGALSGLFKDTEKGDNATKPYLYYRNHEQLYARSFDVKDLTRKDSAFDALAEFDGEKIGVGLKTWIHDRDKSFQKVAEFNKLAPERITPLVSVGDYFEVVKTVAKLRNDRVMLDKRLYNTGEHDIYHYITRDTNCMNIIETTYDLIEEDSIKLIKTNGKTFEFTDGKNNYKYYTSKSVLLEEFDASASEVIEKLPILQFKDPFELLEKIELPKAEEVATTEVIYLPLYTDQTYSLSSKSGLNASRGASKNKEKPGRKRPKYEAYIGIPAWIHYVYPLFFDVNGFDANDIKASKGFNLYLPDGRVVKARVTQENGKALETSPQNILGEWILKQVFSLKPYEELTMEMLNDYGVDSLRITRISEGNYSIDFAETYAFEAWKLSQREKIEKTFSSQELSGKKVRAPKYRDELFIEDNSEE